MTDRDGRQATPQEIAASKRECDIPKCPRKAFLRDWKGWKFCFIHWWLELRWKRDRWFYMRTTRIF